MATTPLVDELSRRFPRLRPSDDAADKVAYARDLWPRHHLAVRAGKVGEHAPAAIVWPDTTEAVVDVVRFAAERGIPIVPFGAGSGVCAGVLPTPETIVVDLKRLARIRSWDEARPTVTVEAGHMGVPFEEALNARGLTLGHFPSSILCSTVGGWIAARSAGQASGRYGKIEDMVTELECVTGRGDVVKLPHRTHGPSLVPIFVGSEGTLGIVTSATLRLHRAPTVRGFRAWSFPTTRHGWEAMRAFFQAGLRPAVARLYDPFDAMLARRGGVQREGKKPAPGMGGGALRTMLSRPGAVNELLESRAGAAALGGSLLLVIFDGNDDAPLDDVARAMRIAEELGGKDEGETPARKWLAHRYAVSYRQAPVFREGMFVDTMEVAATWSRLGALFDGVRRALGEHVFVMAHFSHAYPDGCCIYFSFAGTAARDGGGTWDERCARTYDRAWKSALAAAVEAGGTLAHHHGAGRSKAPRLPAELGVGLDVFRRMKRAFDPHGILNPGALVPEGAAALPGAVANGGAS